MENLEKLVSLLEGDDSLLMRALGKLNIGVATKYCVVKEDELLCEPVIWVEEDLEHVTLEQWGGTRAYKTLNERSIEEGQEIKHTLELMALDKLDE
jgi:hypothetical protein